MDLSLFLDPSILFELVLQGLVRGSMYALMAVGLSLIFGILNVVNFAHGELFMIGAYVMYFVVASLGFPIIVGIAVAALALFVIGMLIERALIDPLRRRSGRGWLLDAFVLTIGLTVVFQNLATELLGSRRQGLVELIPGSIDLMSVSLSYDRLLILVTTVIVGAAVWLFVRYTPLGKAIRATGQDAEAARALGIGVRQIYMITFGIGAGLAGVSGALLITIFPAYPTVGMLPVMKSFAVVVLGGLGNLPGAIIGGFLLGILEAFTAFSLAAGWQHVLTAALVVLILVIRPQGLFVVQGARP